MAERRVPGHFSEESERHIVDLRDGGKTSAELQNEYDLSHSTVHRRVKAVHENGFAEAEDNRTEEEDRLLELEKENKLVGAYTQSKSKPMNSRVDEADLPNIITATSMDTPLEPIS